jgi:hypothetical protein
LAWYEIAPHRRFAREHAGAPAANDFAESLARGSPAGGAGKALGVAGISTNRSQNGEREGMTLPEAIRRLIPIALHHGS